MAKKKSAPKKSTPQKSTLNKIAGKIGQLAGEIVVGKDHIIEMAEGAIDSVKETIHNITSTGKTVPKKAVKVLAKKSIPKKVQDTIKKKARPAAPKKAPASKKVVKKVVKKAAVKK